jgi:chromate transporter
MPEAAIEPLAQPSAPERPHSGGSAWEVLRIFSRLGVTCFGGPIAHIGYFHDEFVTRRKWLSDTDFADLVGLCQFLPGPASSKLGFSIGIQRAGYAGGLAAWVGFTMPSVLLLVAFAFWADNLARSQIGLGLLHGLKLVAVAIVAQAVWGMATKLAPDAKRAAIAVAAAAIALLAPTAISQIGAIVIGALAGLLFCQNATEAVPEPLRLGVSRTVGAIAAIAFVALLVFSFVAVGNDPAGMFSAFYRSGALVFGGGHVVLPLLDQAVVAPGWIDREFFLGGYGAAQAVPGPLFTFGAYLGTAPGNPVSGIPGAGLALVAIFLPGILLQLAAIPFWEVFRKRSRTQALMRGINAAVVGILGAALYSPVWTSAVLRPVDFIIALAGFVLLMAWRTSPIIVVVLSAAAGALTVAAA